VSHCVQVVGFIVAEQLAERPSLQTLVAAQSALTASIWGLIVSWVFKFVVINYNKPSLLSLAVQVVMSRELMTVGGPAMVLIGTHDSVNRAAAT
jgi:hypothetical protein